MIARSEDRIASAQECVGRCDFGRFSGWAGIANQAIPFFGNTARAPIVVSKFYERDVKRKLSLSPSKGDAV